MLVKQKTSDNVKLRKLNRSMDNHHSMIKDKPISRTAPDPHSRRSATSKQRAIPKASTHSSQAVWCYPPQNGQMPAYGNYPNSPYGQQGQVYQQRQY